MKLHQYVRPELVLLDMKANGVHEAIRVLVDKIREHRIVGDPAVLEAALLTREEEHSTAIGDGVAVPHATLPGLAMPTIMVAVAPEGVPFAPVGFDPVQLFFLLLSPANQAELHIKLLARISRLVRHPGFIARLRSAESVERLLEEIERVDSEHV